MKQHQIRELREHDSGAIETLAQCIWGDDAEAVAKRPPGWNRRAWVAGHAEIGQDNKTTLVAEVDGRVIAVGSILHARPRAHLRITTDPRFSAQKEIGIDLFQALNALAENKHYLIREWKDDPTHPLELYKRLGFRFAEQCTEGWIDPAREATAAWITGRLAAVPEEITVVHERHPVAFGRQVELAGLLHRREQRFTEEAFALPPSASPETKDPSDEELIKRYLGRSIPETLYSVHIENDIIAAGSLTHPIFGEDASSAHFSWGGVADLNRPDAYIVTETLVAHLLSSAGQRKLRVQVEFANHHIHKYRCIHSIPGTDLVEVMVLMIKDAPDV